ncbi:hypothetical protein [Leisingera sp. HS039]|nr:hypothetical protein [Leisingera sp. HS039]
MELTTSDMDDEHLLLDCFRSSVCALLVASNPTYQNAAFSRSNVLSTHVYLSSPKELGDSIYYAITASHAALDFEGRTSADATLEVAAFAVTSVGAMQHSGKAVRDVLRKSLFIDAAVSTNAQLLGNKLWNNDAPILQLQVQWDRFIEHCKKHSHWLFWRDWYQGILDGKPLDWELQRRVALIDDAIWDAGPEAVAAEIERIKAGMLSEHLPMAETIELNPETGKFRAVPIPVENAPYMFALLSQIEDALEDCLGGHNGLSERAGDVRKLNRVLTKYRDDPQNAELTLTRVAGSLRAQLHNSRELPDNEDNLALLNAVEEGVRGIRANHPDVAANREQLAQQALKALTPEDKQVLDEALPMLAAISEPALAENFEQDIPELINDALLPLPDGAPPLPGADAVTRIFSRVSKIALLQEQYDKLTRKGAEWFDSDIRKTVQLAGMAGGAVVTAAISIGPKLLELVQIGLRILGVL